MPNHDWECMLKGDKNAFLTIYQNHYTSLFHYGFGLTRDRELTKDCIQELFLEIWNTKAILKTEVDNVQGYLFTWLRRKISKTLACLHKERLVEKETSVLDSFEWSYEELLISFQQTEEKKESLKKALTKLTKKQIEIIRLKFFENLSYAAIADKTSLSTRTVYNIIYEAIRHLREDRNLNL